MVASDSSSNTNVVDLTITEQRRGRRRDAGVDVERGGVQWQRL